MISNDCERIGVNRIASLIWRLTAFLSTARLSSRFGIAEANRAILSAGDWFSIFRVIAEALIVPTRFPSVNTAFAYFSVRRMALGRLWISFILGSVREARFSLKPPSVIEYHRLEAAIAE